MTEKTIPLNTVIKLFALSILLSTVISYLIIKPRQGPEGSLGSIGPQGPLGETGSMGLQGPAGPVGIQGEHGEVGPQGSPGSWPKPDYDSGWREIEYDPSGRALELNHELETEDILVYVVGRQWSEGPIHQYYLGGNMYRDDGLYLHNGLFWSWNENTLWIGRGRLDSDYMLFRVFIWRIPKIT